MPDPFGLPLGGQRLVVADRSGRLTGREIVIPSLRGHPDALKGGPWDKEFDRGMPSGYTVTTPPTAWDANKTVPGHLYVKCAANTWTLITWPSPPAPFTLIGKLAARAWYPAAANHSQQPCLIVSTATPSSATRAAEGVLTNGDGTANVTPQAAGGASVNLATSPAYSMDGPIWYRMKVNSNTSIDCYFSFDGRLWTFNGNVNPGFTVASMGVQVRQSGANPAGGYECAWAYLRVTIP